MIAPLSSSPLATASALPFTPGAAPAEGEATGPDFAQLLGQAQGRQEAASDAPVKAGPKDGADPRANEGGEATDNNGKPTRARQPRPGAGAVAQGNGPQAGHKHKAGDNTPLPGAGDEATADDLATEAADEGAPPDGAGDTRASTAQADAAVLLASLAATRAGVAAAQALAPPPTAPASPERVAAQEGRTAADLALGERPPHAAVRTAAAAPRAIHGEAQSDPSAPEASASPGEDGSKTPRAAAQAEAPATPTPAGTPGSAHTNAPLDPNTNPAQPGTATAGDTPAHEARALPTNVAPPAARTEPAGATRSASPAAAGTEDSSRSNPAGPATADTPRSAQARPQAAASAAPTPTATAQRADAERSASPTASAAGRQERSFAAELQAALPASPPPGAWAPAAALAAATGRDTAAESPSAQARLNAAPGSPEFAPELGTQISTFVRDGVHHARLELNPAEMGPVSVQIQPDGNAAQVRLAADNADTRQALEQAMPQLAGSLREAGLTLTGGGVFEQPRQPQGEASSGGTGGRGGSARDGEGAGPAPLATEPPSGRRRGMVDLVA